MEKHVGENEELLISTVHNIVQNRDKVNYSNELERIRGYLTRAGPRLPKTVERLKRREAELKKLGAQISN